MAGIIPALRNIHKQQKQVAPFRYLTHAKGENALDGIKADQQGNLYVSGPGGLWILSPDGKHLGTIIAPMHPHNMAWGDEDGKTLYLTARSGLYRMRLNIPGSPPGIHLLSQAAKK